MREGWRDKRRVMERGQAFRISSARVSSPNIWRIGGETDVFWRRSSAKEENVEEALTWIALEKLPIYLRIQRGILTEAEGWGREIEVQSLEIIERRNLLERLLKAAKEDNKKFLMKLKQRIERFVRSLDFFQRSYCECKLTGWIGDVLKQGRAQSSNNRG